MRQRSAISAPGMLIVLACFAACASAVKQPDVAFSYNKILKKEYKFDVGKVVPVTIEQAIETDGEFSPDGAYFFFASNRERGNFDIYLRSLTDITTVRVSSHPSKDTAPALSPDGGYLAFVSQREDPEGDIFIVEIDPEKLLKRAAAPGAGIGPLDARAVNITPVLDELSKAPKSIRDASPAWSPDGRTIVFSSMRDSTENLWMTDRKGKRARQLTRKGGMYPRFSNDGKKIVYISYRDDGGNGDVYILDTVSGEERRITNTAAIEFNPCFGRSSNEIYYTLIDRDTNGDGIVSLKDNPVIQYRNPGTGREYPLTRYSQASFSPRFSAIYDGVVVFSDQSGENININVIPDTGIIPLRENASRQYDLSEKYLKEFDDPERYILSLERVHHFFGTAGDTESVIYTARALAEAARYNLSRGNRADALRQQAVLASLRKGKNDYRGILASYIELILHNKPGLGVLKDSLGELRKENAGKAFVPYLMEDIADEYLRLGMQREAAVACGEIILAYPTYKRLIYVHMKNAAAAYTAIGAEIHPSYISVLNSNYQYQKNEAVINLLNLFGRVSDPQRRLAIGLELLVRYRDSKSIPALLHYVIGRASLETGDNKSAGTHLREALRISGKSDLIFYKSNVALGELSARFGIPANIERYYSAAAGNYRLMWRQDDIRTIVGGLIDHYERYGESAEFSGNYAESASLYKKYVWLLTYLNLIKRFDDIYNRYAARAHVLYIDAYAAQHGDEFSALDTLEREYLNRLDIARLDRDKAHIYGLGYIYSKMALSVENKASVNTGGVTIVKGGARGMLKYFRDAVVQLDWALFIDDTFIDPYILYGWIYQYVDLRRKDDQLLSGGKNAGLFAEFFPRYLWERNIDLYRKALETNAESENPGKEGNLHLNIANTFFLLSNYPRALQHYEQVPRFKKSFSTRIEEALFHYHLGYCYYQTGAYAKSRDEMNRALIIYRALASGGNMRIYKNQILSLYRFFALLHRLEKNYADAVVWFSRILDFAGENSIRIDRARYFQEIAWCYRAMGESERALSWLDRAGAVLKRYRETEAKYSLTLTVLGLGPVPVWDFGPDTAVIGNNRIYTGLNTAAKRLLNLSMQEEIWSSRGDYAKSVEYLKEKLDELKKPRQRSDRESRLRTLNNIGHGYFRMREYRKAEEYFRSAWAYADTPDVNDMEGAFASIINIANLYAFLADNALVSRKDSLPEIDGLISRISSYRGSYEEKRYKDEAEKLRGDAGRQRREVGPDELASLRKKIRVDAAEIYYAIDIVLGVVKFYKAELPADRGVDAGTGVADAFALYKSRRDVYDLYAQANRAFESALPRAERDPSKRLMARLLMNIAACQERTGLVSEAYSSLSAAERTILDNAYVDLEWLVYDRLAAYLTRHGSTAAGEGYRGAARNYYRKALEIIEELPWQMAGSLARVRGIYDGYIALLLDEGDSRGALSAAERKAGIERVMLVRTAWPAFSEAREREYYRNILLAAEHIDELLRRISTLIESGEAPGSIKVIAVRGEVRAEKLRLERILEDARSFSPLFASYISAGGDDLRLLKGGAAFRFFRSGGAMHVWKAGGAGMEYKKFIMDGAAPGSGLRDDISRYLREASAEKLPVFLVLDEHSMEMLADPGFRGGLRAFTFVTSIERARYYLTRDGAPMAGACLIGIEKKGRVKDIDESGRAAGQFLITTGCAEEDALSLYSLIADASDAVKPATLFSRRLGSAMLIKNIPTTGMDGIRLLAESALYSGIDSLVLLPGAGAERIAEILEDSMSIPLEKINVREGGAGLYGVGFRGAGADERAAAMVRFKESWLEKSRAAFGAGDMAGARTGLYRWKELAGDGPETRAEFFIRLSDIETVRENLKDAQDSAEKALELSRGRYPGIYVKALSSRIYLMLYRGDTASAAAVLKDTMLPSEFTASVDHTVFMKVLDLAQNGPSGSVDFTALFAASKKFIIPGVRLRLLAAEYLGLYRRPESARGLLSGAPADGPLSPREKCALALLGELHTQAPAKGDGAAGESFCASKGDMQRLIRDHRFADATALYRSLEVDELLSRAHWMDAVSFFDFAREVMRTDGDYSEAFAAAGRALALLKGRGIASLEKGLFYSAASYAMRLGRHRESMELAEKGLLLPEDGNRLAVKFRMLLMENEIAMGKPADAARRETAIPAAPDEADAGTLDLLRFRITLAGIVKKRSASENEWKELESLVISALGHIDRAPGFDRQDLAQRGLDVLISYKMSRNDYLAALLYAEIKKQLQLRITFPHLAESGTLPAAAVHEFRGLRDRAKDSEKFIALLNRYPLLQAGAFASMLPVEAFQRRLPDNAVALYLVRNENDIFCWVIAGQFIMPLRIRNGYADIASLKESFSGGIAGSGETAAFSRRLYSVFRPLESYYRTRETIIIIPDRDLEWVPFELIGEKTMMEDSGALMFLPSILTGLYGGAEPAARIQILDPKEGDAADELDRLAIGQSGIPRSGDKAPSGDYVHIMAPVTYDPAARRPYVNGKSFGDVLRDALSGDHGQPPSGLRDALSEDHGQPPSGLRDALSGDHDQPPSGLRDALSEDHDQPPSGLRDGAAVYMAVAGFSGREMAAMLGISGLKAVVFYGASIRDVNSAVFIKSYYSEIADGRPMRQSFRTAKSVVRRKEQFRHPAYWAGIRLYLGGL